MNDSGDIEVGKVGSPSPPCYSLEIDGGWAAAGDRGKGTEMGFRHPDAHLGTGKSWLCDFSLLSLTFLSWKGSRDYQNRWLTSTDY